MKGKNRMIVYFGMAKYTNIVFGALSTALRSGRNRSPNNCSTPSRSNWSVFSGRPSTADRTKAGEPASGSCAPLIMLTWHTIAKSFNIRVLLKKVKNQ